jgi:putative Mg2+ transporter-C (MgtC) family protein
VIPVEVIAIRLALALLFGALIGVEREVRQKHAGLKTMTLVSLGAAAFAGNHNPAQMAAMVATGIGFIGAGVIIHREATVEGVTTAATLWAAASVGVAAGIGQLTLAGTLTAAVAIVQLTFPYVEKMIHRNGNDRG